MDVIPFFQKYQYLKIYTTFKNNDTSRLLSYRPTTTTFLLLLAIRHIFFNSIIIIMVVNAGIYCPFRICLLHGSAVQRAAVRRTLIKEFYGSLLVLLEHFCLYDLVLEFSYLNGVPRLVLMKNLFQLHITTTKNSDKKK